MENVPIPPEAAQDPVEKNVPGQGYGRDPERTPMRWDSGANAGFTTGKPWLPLGEDYGKVNVSAEREDPRSVLSLYRGLISLRQSEPALMVGSYQAVPAQGDVLAYVREAAGSRFFVALNLGHETQRVELPEAGRIAVSTGMGREGEAVSGPLELRGDEGVVVELRSA